MNRQELKANAKLQIKGNIGILFAITTIVVSLTGASMMAMYPFVVAGIVATIFVVGPAFALSVNRIYLAMSYGQKPSVGDVFSGFDDFWSAFKVSFLVSLYTSLWSILFIIPGIVKAYSYSQAMLILAQNKGMSARACINASKQMTRGHKGDLFVLDLSFIGWNMLAPLTFGILYIWLVPYMSATKVNAHNWLCAQQYPQEEPVYEQSPETPFYEQSTEPLYYEETPEAPTEE